MIDLSRIVIICTKSNEICTKQITCRICLPTWYPKARCYPLIRLNILIAPGTSHKVCHCACYLSFWHLSSVDGLLVYLLHFSRVVFFVCLVGGVLFFLFFLYAY